MLHTNEKTALPPSIFPSLPFNQDTMSNEETYLSQTSDIIKSPTNESLPKILDSTSSAHSSSAGDIRPALAVFLPPKKRGNLSHLSESDRRSEASYRSEPSMAISDAARSSKFKVVKLGDKTPYVRGRFTCFDFHDLPVKESTTTTVTVAGRPEVSSPSTTPRIQTPSIITDQTGPNGTLTSSSAASIGVVSASTASSGSETTNILPSLSVPTEPTFHNLHLTAAAPVASVQRTGTLVRSPLAIQPQRPPPSSRSPVPPNTPTSPNMLGAFSTALDNAATNGSPERSHTQSPVPSQTLNSSIQPTVAPEQLMMDSLARKNPTPHSDNNAISRSSISGPSGTTTPNRKISGTNAPDPTRLLRMKGETFFAEMIDRVWESSAPLGNKPTGEGFDRIEAKIQQCMSLVTEHVLLAVRSDLDELNKQVKIMRERAASLECENQVLKMENILLRNAVNNSATGPADVTPSRSRMK